MSEEDLDKYKGNRKEFIDWNEKPPEDDEYCLGALQMEFTIIGNLMIYQLKMEG